ncbi:MAG: L,D-transpeptidase [Chloroflexota bacterium]
MVAKMAKTSVKTSRREFLNLGVASLAAAFLAPFGSTPPVDDPFPLRTSAYSLGRVTRSNFYFQDASFKSKKLRGYNTNTIMKIFDQKKGDMDFWENPLWFQAENGWVNAAFITPVRNETNEPVTDMPAGGFLAEVTVPMTWAFSGDAGETMKQIYALFYGMTWWVDYHNVDKQGTHWYRIYDDLEETNYWAPAQHFRRVFAEELAPTSMTILDKRIEISLASQTLTAFENGKAVFTSAVSTGAKEGDTKPGEYVIERKRPSRHMAPMEGNGYDLPGVPWVSFISWTGVSIHGTYWHNNFGHPMSHGCINLPTPAAKWVYLWSMPVVPAEKQSIKEDGTRVVIT